jgi:hypothetical protein
VFQYISCDQRSRRSFCHLQGYDEKALVNASSLSTEGLRRSDVHVTTRESISGSRHGAPDKIAGS